eukprot:2897622-Pyramimonas_sp.AAC.1
MPGNRPWTRCKACGTCEYNHKLDSKNPTCPSCQRRVKLHRTRSRSPSVTFGGTEIVELEDPGAATNSRKSSRPPSRRKAT